MSLTKPELEHLARLARLDLTESEKTEFTEEVNQVLNFIARLNQLDPTGIGPVTPAIPVSNVFRPDWTGPSLDPEEALANAPDRKANFFKVPRIIAN